MGSPLTPLSPAKLNTKSPTKSPQKSEIKTPLVLEHRCSTPDISLPEDQPSLGLICADVPVMGYSPTSTPELTPNLRIEEDVREGERLNLSKVRSPTKTPSPTKSLSTERRLAESRGTSSLHEDDSPAITAAPSSNNDAWNDEEGGQSMVTVGVDSVHGDVDDTAFSTFSAVPNADMTLFARWGQDHSQGTSSPTRQSGMERLGMHHGVSQTSDEEESPMLGTARRVRREGCTPSPSPASRRTYDWEQDNDTTDLIVDFTEQFNALTAPDSSYPQVSPNKRGRVSPTKSHTQPNLALHLAAARAASPPKFSLPPATPSRRGNLATLLDFDIPPAPTPRSIPSVSARELESLKSSYLSQISSLKAALSGREAEVKSLMDAVADAERRVGEAQEAVREVRGQKEALQADKDNWETRGKEMEALLRNVKDEVIRSEEEKTNLATKLEDAERRCDEAETRAARMSAGPGPENEAGSSQESIQPQIDRAVEKVARELHALYKAKHQTKVGALKKSYEARWEKRVKELENKLEEANKEVEEMRMARDVTLSGVLPANLHAHHPEDTNDEKAGLTMQLEEQKTRVAGLMEDLAILKRDNNSLVLALERERVEKGDLVAAVEEMLSISSVASAGDDGAVDELESIRGTISRASGRSVASAISATHGRPESRLARATSIPGPDHLRSGSGSYGFGAKSGIMSNIERMGKGRGES